MSKAASAAGRNACLLLATFFSAATVAASVRSFVSEAPAESAGLALLETEANSQESVVSKKLARSEQPWPSEQAWPFAPSGQVLPRFDGGSTFALASVTPESTQARPSLAPLKHALGTHDSSYGLASYYGHRSRTANGEEGNGRELTAAHRTLPFGTHVRVTNLSTGQSVMVRINDRGPFIRGRIVDLSYSAAEKLGLVGPGIAKVKLDVVD
jgi:peptidoglycan lytic transglycosylase